MALEVSAAMAAQDFWPHWAFLAKYGLGEPSLLFYAPLYYLAAGILGLLLPNSWVAMQTVEVASLVMAGGFGFALARHFAPARFALLAVPLVIFGPMLSLLHFGFNGYPWATAFGPLSMFTWAMLRPRAQSQWINGWAIIALALLIATHTVTGLMAVISFAPLALATILSSGGKWHIDIRRAAMPMIAIAGGLLLSAAYLYPAVSLMKLIDAEVWRRDYTPFDAFALPTLTAYIFGLRWFAFQWPISIAAICGCGVALVSIWKLSRPGSPARRMAFHSGLIALTATILATELSYPLWLVDTPLRSVQFPHRFITILSVLFAAMAPVALALAWERRKRPALYMVGACIAFSLALGTFVVVKAAVFDEQPITVSRDRLEPYRSLDEYQLHTTGPDWVSFATRGWSAECARIDATCSVGKRRGSAMSWTIETKRAATVRLPLFAFPAWQVSRNGSLTATTRDSKTGVIATALPVGKSVITVHWHRLPEQRTGLAITLAMTLALIAYGASKFLRRHRHA